MITLLTVGGINYLSNEWLQAPLRAEGAYVGQEPVAKINMQFLKDGNPNQDLEWVDILVVDDTTIDYQPVAADAASVGEDILYFDDPITGMKLCFLEQTLYDSYQAVWDGDGIIDQTYYDAQMSAAWQAAWPQHDSNLAAYGQTLTKSEGMTAGQRFGLYNDALAILGLEPDFTYDPPRGPIEQAVHQYAINIDGA